MPRSLATNRALITRPRRLCKFINQACRHVGSNRTNDRIIVPNAFDFSSGDWTLFGEFMAESNSGGFGIVAQDSVQSVLMVRSPNATFAGGGQKISVNNGIATASFSSRIRNGKWYKYELKYTQSTGTVELWLNGVKDSTVLTGYNFTSSSANVNIGVFYNTNSGLTGRTYGCYLYEGHFTDDERDDWFSNGVPPQSDSGYTDYNFALDYAELTGNFIDKSPNAYSCTLANGVLRKSITPSKARKAPRNYAYSLVLDGATGRIEIPNTSAFDNLFSDGGTLRLRLNALDFGELSSGMIFTVNNASFFIEFGANRMQMSQVYSGGTNQWRILGVNSSAAPLRFGKFIDLIITFDASNPNNDPVLFLNGQQLYVVLLSARATGTPTSDAGSQKFVGNTAADNRTFRGFIELIELYSKQLSAGEVYDLVIDNNYEDLLDDMIEGWTPSEGSGSSVAGRKSVGSLTLVTPKWSTFTSNKTKVPVS